MQEEDIIDTARELLAGSEGGETPTFQTGERSDCSREACQVRSQTITFENWAKNVLGWKVVILDNAITYEYDGCDVFNGDVSLTTTRTRPLDTAKLSWTFRPVETTAPSGCPQCCQQARCIELTVKNELVSGLNIFRLIGIGGNSIWERKFLICGDGSCTQTAGPGM